jgi:hemerythrin
MNVLITWDEKFALNIKEIDQQHKKFIDMINVLYDSCSRKVSEEVLEQTIADMRDYAFVHFRNEEKYFERVGFKEAPSHIAQHHFFLENIERIQEQYCQNDFALPAQVLTFLQEWLTNHIMNSDRKYVASFVEHGIK